MVNTHQYPQCDKFLHETMNFIGEDTPLLKKRNNKQIKEMKKE